MTQAERCCMEILTEAGTAAEAFTARGVGAALPTGPANDGRPGTLGARHPAPEALRLGCKIVSGAVRAQPVTCDIAFSDLRYTQTLFPVLTIWRCHLSHLCTRSFSCGYRFPYVYVLWSVMLCLDKSNYGPEISVRHSSFVQIPPGINTSATHISHKHELSPAVPMSLIHIHMCTTPYVSRTDWIESIRFLPGRISGCGRSPNALPPP